MEEPVHTAGAHRSEGRPARRPVVRFELAPDHAPLPHVLISGIRVHAITEKTAVSHIFDSLQAGNGGWVVTANLDFLRRLATDDVFHAVYNQATLALADGMPLVWAARLQKTPIPQRVAGSDLISSASAAAAAAGRSIFLLGGDPGTADGAAQVLRARHPDLKIAGTHCPPPGFETDTAAMRDITDRLTRAAPDLVFVALGSPKQEFLIREIRSLLPHAWWFGLGISFSFLTGEVKRAPKWMQRSGLEWIHRLFQEPRRLARRYLVDGLPFAAKLFFHALARRFTDPLQPAPVAPRSSGTSTPRVAPGRKAA